MHAKSQWDHKSCLSCLVARRHVTVSTCTWRKTLAKPKEVEILAKKIKGSMHACPVDTGPPTWLYEPRLHVPLLMLRACTPCKRVLGVELHARSYLAVDHPSYRCLSSRRLLAVFCNRESTAHRCWKPCWSCFIPLFFVMRSRLIEWTWVLIDSQQVRMASHGYASSSPMSIKKPAFRGENSASNGAITSPAAAQDLTPGVGPLGTLVSWQQLHPGFSLFQSLLVNSSRKAANASWLPHSDKQAWSVTIPIVRLWKTFVLVLLPACTTVFLQVWAARQDGFKKESSIDVVRWPLGKLQLM